MPDSDEDKDFAEDEDVTRLEKEILDMFYPDDDDSANTQSPSHDNNRLPEDSTTDDGAMDVDEPPEHSTIYTEHFQGAAKVLRTETNLFHNLLSEDEFYDCRQTNRYYPFSCETEWEVARWLSGLNVSVEKLDAFFKLKYVSETLSCALV